jgi:hypothetical protein
MNKIIKSITYALVVSPVKAEIIDAPIRMRTR